MEGNIGRHGCRGLRAAGTALLVASVVLAMPGSQIAFAQAGEQRRMPVVVQANPPAGPEDPVQNQIRDLNRRQEELVQKAQQRESQLRELNNDADRRRQQTLDELRQIHEQMRGTERDLIRLDEQRRERLENQVARAQDRARSLMEQMEKLRAQTGEVQRQMEQTNEQSRRQAAQIASALEQTRRQMRIVEERLSGPPAPYQPRMELVVPSVRGRVEEPVNRPQPQDQSIRNDLDQLRVKLDVIQQQVQQTQTFVERHVGRDNPYSVGSVGGNWYPNWGW